MRGCTPWWRVRSIRRAQAAAPLTAASTIAGPGPARVTTERLWSGSLERSSTSTSGCALASAATISSTTSARRPSEKFGTISTSPPSPSEGGLPTSREVASREPAHSAGSGIRLLRGFTEEAERDAVAGDDPAALDDRVRQVHAEVVGEVQVRAPGQHHEVAGGPRRQPAGRLASPDRARGAAGGSQQRLLRGEAAG